MGVDAKVVEEKLEEEEEEEAEHIAYYLLDLEESSVCVGYLLALLA